MKNRDYRVYIVLTVAALLWLIFLPYFYQEFISKFYYMPFLGIVAATVANTTPAAAGIVYFPILTRLHITPATAVQFSLIIQAYGMGLGTFKWFMINKKLFLLNVIPICLIGGTLGIFVSIVLFPIDNSEMLTLIFNGISFLLTQIIFFSILFNHQYPKLNVELNLLNIFILLSCSFVGGMISGWIGFGIDTIFYFILTVWFRVNPAVAIVTSISIMAAMSMAGTMLNVICHDVPISLWYSAIPGVTIAGLFLAAYLAIRLGARNVLLLFSFFLICDFFVSFWTQRTIPIHHSIKLLITYGLIAYLVVIHVKIFKKSYDEIKSSVGDFTIKK